MLNTYHATRKVKAMTECLDSLGSLATLKIRGRAIDLFRVDAVTRAGLGDVGSLPFSIRVLLENLLRNEDGATVTKDDIVAIASWDPEAKPSHEIAYRPARVLLQDFTGVPAVVDLAAMREALASMGGDASRINPLRPVDLVIDHSVQVDSYGSPSSFAENERLECERNRERYQLLKWGQSAFKGFRVVPPGKGIVHQVNLEYLAPVVFLEEREGRTLTYPDTLVGTDSHTTMINGLGVLGWGVGGIEAEAAMLGQPIFMLLPQVVGFKLTGTLREGVTATDLVLTVVQMLRQKMVVGKFVEFLGDGLDALSLSDRATIANMAPESGATVCFFPVDDETLAYLRFTGRDEDQVELVEVYSKEQGLFRISGASQPRYTDTLELELGEVVSSLAGPKRPQDRIDLRGSKQAWQKVLPTLVKESTAGAGSIQERELPECADSASEGFGVSETRAEAEDTAESPALQHGSVVIAAITSCTNTSNPAVLVAAGLLAKKAVDKGLSAKPWVKTSLAPGSQVVTDYLHKAGLMEALEKLNFHLVAYGCTTCIGNSGPLPRHVAGSIEQDNLVVVSVLSGNRNFEGRINQHVRANYLASPPLVVAYALAGTMDIDFEREPIGEGEDGKAVFLRDIWPLQHEVRDAIRSALESDMFTRRYRRVFEGTGSWRSIETPQGDTFEWDVESTYIRKPPFFDGVSAEEPEAPKDIVAARVLAMLGDSVTTDHISPAGAIAPDSPAARYLQGHGVLPIDFNSYGSRRGNHEAMVRGTFANVRLRNVLAPGTEGGITRHLPDGEPMSIYDAAMLYRAEGVPLLVLAGKEYGAGSSRDWAAKGTLLLGVRAVIAQSFERIHRSNLIGMGVLPLEFLPGESIDSLGLAGEEEFSICGIATPLTPGKRLRVTAGAKEFEVVARLDTPHEVDHYAHGGMLQYVLRQLAMRRDNRSG
jgi:aconitate hydratase